MFQVLSPPPAAAPQQAAPRARGYQRRGGLGGRLAPQVLLTVVSVVVAAPLVWLVLAVFRRPGAIFAGSLPLPPSIGNVLHALAALPWGTLLLHTVAVALGVSLGQHLTDFPAELLEAARVDGLSSWSVLWRVVVPNLAPALAALEILLFIGAWNEYLWPLSVYNTPASVLQVGIRDMLNVDNVDYGALLAATGLATLPLLVLYPMLQRRVVNAYVRSGLR